MSDFKDRIMAAAEPFKEGQAAEYYEQIVETALNAINEEEMMSNHKEVTPLTDEERKNKENDVVREVAHIAKHYIFTPPNNFKNELKHILGAITYVGWFKKHKNANLYTDEKYKELGFSHSMWLYYVMNAERHFDEKMKASLSRLSPYMSFKDMQTLKRYCEEMIFSADYYMMTEDKGSLCFAARLLVLAAESKTGNIAIPIKSAKKIINSLNTGQKFEWDYAERFLKQIISDIEACRDENGHTLVSKKMLIDFLSKHLFDLIEPTGIPVVKAYFKAKMDEGLVLNIDYLLYDTGDNPFWKDGVATYMS